MSTPATAAPVQNAVSGGTVTPFRIETIRLAANPEYQDSTESTVALVVGQFGAHPAVDDDSWAVTHLGSGFRVPTRDALSWHEALRFARALSEVADWPQDAHIRSKPELRKYQAEADQALGMAGISTVARRRAR